MLEKVLAAHQKKLSVMTREWIEEEHREVERAEFRALLKELQKHPIALPPPDELSREMDEARCPLSDCNDHDAP